jgi:hypothetical protein
LTDDLWDLGFVLPNLVLPHDDEDSNPGAFPLGISFAPSYLRIFPGRHPAVLALRSRVSAVEQILLSFRDEYGKPYSPAVLLVRADTPQLLKNDLEAFVSFRNAIAMSVVLRGRASVVLDRGAPSGTWSDTFDFHPVQIGGMGRMIIQSPALVSLVSETAKLHLTHSPYLQLEGRRLWLDHYLFWALGQAWSRRFAPTPRADSFAQRAFRSLEAAYQACAVGAKNEASLHEYGTQIALWVSACEILAWPDQKRADLPAVIALLAGFQGGRATMRKRFSASYRGQRLRLTAPQRAYTRLYSARNDFLHGNPVSVNTMMTQNRRANVSLPRIAAIVYRTALASYLNKRYPIEVPLQNLKERSMEMFDHYQYEQALAESFGYDL